MKYIKALFLSIFFLGSIVGSMETADARLIFSNENPEWDGTEFVLDVNDNSVTNVDLKFGSTATGRIRFDVINDNFEINKDIDFELNQLVNARLENISSVPTCDPASTGYLYFNTTSSTTFICNGNIWTPLNGSITDSDGDTQIQVEEGADDDTIRFDTAGVERMVIGSTGNIGIGVAVPNEELEISGDLAVGGGIETLSDAGFILNGNDVFIADSLGVEGAIYTDDTQTKYQSLDIFGCVRGSASSGTIAGGRSAVVRFDGANNSQMRCSISLPDDWVSGTDVNFDIQWSPGDNGSGGLYFDFDYASFSVGDTINSGAFTDTSITSESVVASTDSQLYSFIVTIPNSTITADDMLGFRLMRAPGNAADTYGDDINIHSIRFSYTGKKLH